MTRTYWTQRLHFGPAARINHGLTYDAARKRVVLFGGSDGDTARFGDTWTWDGSYWTQVAETGPAPREGHSLVYDAANREVMLFGGHDGFAKFGDTWIWDGASWTQVAETGPAARTAHAAAYDDTRKLVTLFGGSVVVEVGDTWEWDGQAWTQREETGPIARVNHAMAYDPATAGVVLFGGLGPGAIFDDTWMWNGTLWTQVAEFGPPPSLGAAMAFDGRGLLLFGGVVSIAAAQPGHDDTWEWRDRFWTKRQVFGPSGRTAHALAFDADRRRITLFGGARVSMPPPNAAALLGDTWEQPAADPAPAGPPFRIVATLPNPAGDETQLEEVHLRNDGAVPIVLAGWRITNAQLMTSWILDATDGVVGVAQTTIVTRRGRPLALTNPGGTVVLVDLNGAIVDSKTYGAAAEGVLITFE